MPPKRGPRSIQAQAEPVAARTTRQRALAPAPTPEQAMPPPASTSPLKPHFKTPSAFPRRSAPNAGYAESIESSHTNDTTYATPVPRSSQDLLAQPEGSQASPRLSRSQRDMSAASENSAFSTRALAKSMQSNLSDLQVHARQLYDHLIDANENDEDWEIDARQLRKRFDVDREAYVLAPDSIFLDPQQVTFVAYQANADKKNDLHRAMMQTLSAANLVVLLDGVSFEDRLATLQSLESAFPNRFHPDSNGLDRDEIFERALDIRTQLFIARLQNESEAAEEGDEEFLPAVILAEVFCEPAAAEADPSIALEQGPFKPFGELNLDLDGTSVHAQRLRDRIESHQGSFRNDLAATLQELDQVYSFEAFWNGAQGMKYWIQSCYNAIAPWVTDHSNVPAGTMAESIDDSEGRSQSQEMIRAGPATHYTPADHNQAAELWARAGGTGSAQGALSRANEQLFGQAAAATAALTGQKRARAQQDEDDGTDDFEVDGRVPASQQKPLRAAPRKRARPAPQQSQEIAVPGPSGQQMAPMPDMGLSQTQLDPDALDIEALSHQAKAVSAARRKKPGPQIRTPWSKNDTQTLIRAIDAFECKWSTMEREINEGRLHFEHARDQQALRDKSRLLKQDILKTDRLLPRGFDLVVLGKKEKAAVTGAGKNPNRTEADVDDQGNAINTEFDEVVNDEAARLQLLQQEQPAPQELQEASQE